MLYDHFDQIVKPCMTTMRNLDSPPTMAMQRLAPSAAAVVLVISACVSHPSPVSGPTSSGRGVSVEKSLMVKPISVGARTDGGLSGSIVRVTTLEADGPGSLRRALEMAQARLVAVSYT